VGRLNPYAPHRPPIDSRLCSSSADHPQLHAQVPAAGPHHQEEGPHRLAAQPQVRGVPHLRLRGDRLHRRHGLPEPAGE